MGSVVPTQSPMASNTPFKTRGKTGTDGARRNLIGSGAQTWIGALHDQFGENFPVY